MALADEGIQGQSSLIGMSNTPIGHLSNQHVCPLPWLEPLWYSCITVQVSLQWNPTQQRYGDWHTISLPCCCGRLGGALSSYPTTHPTRKQGSCGRTGWNSYHLLCFSIWRGHLPGLWQIPRSQTKTEVLNTCYQQPHTKEASWAYCLLHTNQLKVMLSNKSLSFLMFFKFITCLILFRSNPLLSWLIAGTC